MANEDVTKLPKWAQAEIARLNANVASWKAKAEAAMSPNAEGTDTFIDAGLPSEPNRGLPPGSHVCFRIGPAHSDVIECYVSTRHGKSGEAVVFVWAPGGDLMVLPSSSNVALLTAGRR